VTNPESAVDKDYNDTSTYAFHGTVGTGLDIRIYDWTADGYDIWIDDDTGTSATTISIDVNNSESDGYINSSGGVRIKFIADESNNATYEFDLADSLESGTLFATYDSDGGPWDVAVYDTHITTSGNTYDYKGIENPSTTLNASMLTDVSPCYTAWCSETEFTTNQYQQANMSDDTWAQIVPTSANTDAMAFNFKINESVSSISSIFVRWEGYASNRNSNLYIWDSTEWSLIDTYTSNSDDDIGLFGEIDSSISNYIGSDGYLHLKANISAGASGSFYTDYIKVNIITSGSTASNPQSLGTMNAGDMAYPNWTVNATGTTTTQWLVDVFFNSSLDSDVASNHTGDRTVCIDSCGAAAADTSFNITWTDDGYTISTDGGATASSSAWFNSSTGNEKNVNGTIEGSNWQTLTYALMNFTNEGDTALKVELWVNSALPATIKLFGSLDNDPDTGTFSINNSAWATANESVGVGESEDIWVWMNFTNSPSSDSFTAKLWINSSQAS
jgi:hypothetical protein